MKRIIRGVGSRIKIYQNTFKSIIRYFKKNKNYKKNVCLSSLSEKRVVFYFFDKSIVSLSFGYYFPLIIGFIKNGYDVDFHMNWKFHAQVNNQTILLFATKGIFLKRIGTNELKSAEIIFSDKQFCKIEESQRLIILDPDIINRNINAPHEIVQPFFMHPKQFSVNNPDVKCKRKIRIFFSGNSGSAYYNKPVIGGMMNRYEVLSCLKERFPNSSINITNEEYNKSKELSLVIQDWSWNQKEGGNNTQYRIPTENWLEHLSNCSFFLSPPGVNIPFSHNLVEAMSVGAIPITNYNHLFCPPLENNIHCLSFQDKESLEIAIKNALSMDEQSIAKMSKNVSRYYNQYMDPQKFVSELIKNTQVDRVYYYATKLSQRKFNERTNISDVNS